MCVYSTSVCVALYVSSEFLAHMHAPVGVLVPFLLCVREDRELLSE